MLTAILTILAGALTLWGLYAKRKRTPTQDERLDDVDREYADSMARVSELTQQGKRDEADAMLRRLDAANKWLLNNKQ